MVEMEVTVDDQLNVAFVDVATVQLIDDRHRMVGYSASMRSLPWPMPVSTTIAPSGWWMTNPWTGNGANVWNSDGTRGLR